VALAGHPPRIPVLSPGPRVEALAVLASGGQSSDA
jgi:hypothetical protein